MVVNKTRQWWGLLHIITTTHSCGCKQNKRTVRLTVCTSLIPHTAVPANKARQRWGLLHIITNTHSCACKQNNTVVRLTAHHHYCTQLCLQTKQNSEAYCISSLLHTAVPANKTNQWWGLLYTITTAHSCACKQNKMMWGLLHIIIMAHSCGCN